MEAEKERMEKHEKKREKKRRKKRGGEVGLPKSEKEELETGQKSLGECLQRHGDGSRSQTACKSS